MKNLIPLLISFTLISCSSIPYNNIGSNFVKNYCKGKEFFEDTSYFTNEFVANRKKIGNRFEIPCTSFQENFEINNGFDILINGGFGYMNKYDSDKFIDTINNENKKTFYYIKKQGYQLITFSIINQNGVWKIHYFNFDLNKNHID